MSQQAIYCLKQLVKKAETQPERKRDVLLKRQDFSMDPQDPYPFRSADVLRDFHAYLSTAEQKKLISLEWEKHYIGTSLERIRLHDAKGVAGLLNYEYLPDKLVQIEAGIQRPPDGHWLNAVVDEILDAWRHGKRRYGLKIEQAIRLNILVNAVLAIEALPESRILDYRQFGARQLGDSKALLPIVSTLGQIYRNRLDKPELSYEDVLAELNLVKMVHPVLITGPLSFRAGSQVINSAVRPYLGVPGDLLGEFSVFNSPSYLLTIENLSSFLEYTSTIEDDAIVLYTGGYPTRRFQRFYQTLLSRISAPVFHWGDSDPHGFQILKTLQKIAGEKTVLPHEMEIQNGDPFSEEQLRHIERLIPVNPPTDAILSIYLDKGEGIAEQETQTARSPIKQA
ncbi:MAG: Wadjet anti-phage system protein JetD domain-containing protein [Candidatus Thiodiazotropha endolucinida]